MSGAGGWVSQLIWIETFAPPTGSLTLCSFLQTHTHTHSMSTRN